MKDWDFPGPLNVFLRDEHWYPVLPKKINFVNFVCAKDMVKGNSQKVCDDDGSL